MYFHVHVVVLEIEEQSSYAYGGAKSVVQLMAKQIASLYFHVHVVVLEIEEQRSYAYGGAKLVVQIGDRAKSAVVNAGCKTESRCKFRVKSKIGYLVTDN